MIFLLAERGLEQRENPAAYRDNPMTAKDLKNELLQEANS